MVERRLQKNVGVNALHSFAVPHGEFPAIFLSPRGNYAIVHRGFNTKESMISHSLAIGMPGPLELIVIAGFGLLLFGKRLPEVGKGLARSIVEFKKGLKDVTDEIDVGATPSTKSTQNSPPAQPPV